MYIPPLNSNEVAKAAKTVAKEAVVVGQSVEEKAAQALANIVKEAPSPVMKTGEIPSSSLAAFFGPLH